MEQLPREEILTREELKDLMTKQENPCISIYMPTTWVGAETQQNVIRFRNLVRQAEEGLIADGLRPSEIESITGPAQWLLKNSPFWRYQNDGLAAFMSRNVFRYYRLPLNFKEQVISSDRFYLNPLLPLFSSGARFFVLAVSQKNVRFLQGARNCIMELELKKVPKSLAESMRFDSPGRQSRAQPTRGGTATFHGHGTWQDETKANILQFFQQVDKGVQQILKEEKSPLVFLGVEYLFSIYREANSYPFLLDRAITGSPEGVRATDLGLAAWDIVKPFYERAQEDAAAQYRQSAGTGLTSNNLREIVPESYYGRVGILFVESGRTQPGSFDPATGELVVGGEDNRRKEDLLDFAAIHTFLNGGTVYLVPKDKMPDGSTISALYRY